MRHYSELLQARKLASVGLAIVAITGLFGCGGGPDPNAVPPGMTVVKGKVTLDGTPVQAGFVQLVAIAPPKSIDQGTIANGEYRMFARATGKMKVEIRSALGADQVVPPEQKKPGQPIAIPPDPIPAKYNDQTTLTIDVAPGTENTHDFPLTTK